MSRMHPIISITGSSGAGTTSVMRTFDQIFRREGVNAAFVEGDSFHRHDRAGMTAAMAEATTRSAISAEAGCLRPPRTSARSRRSSPPPASICAQRTAPHNVWT